MQTMQSHDIRSRFIAFFEKRQHAILPSASLVTPDQKSVTDSTLFNTAGMQPLVPYLLGETHPAGTRLASVQKCVRTVDIDSIGDNTHATFFEMLGNWSLGDYWKKESINWSYEFLTSKKEGLGLDPHRLYITVFEGDENAPRDEESYKIWKEIFEKNGISGERIYFMSAKSNWWSAGDNGPCGPDTEMFYDLTGTLTGGMTQEKYIQADLDQHVVEIWNNVFMEYLKKDGIIVGQLPNKNVDTGAGLERLTAVIEGVQSIFETDLFTELIKITRTIAKDEISTRIIADHTRTAVFLITDGVIPSNTGRGYILRRLLRRSVFYTEKKQISLEDIAKIVSSIVSTYKNSYPEIGTKKEFIKKIINEEIEKFKKTLTDGLKYIEEEIATLQINGTVISKTLPPTTVFNLYASHGMPIELIVEVAKANGKDVDMSAFNRMLEEHQTLSRVGAEQKFKGGLADTNDPVIIKYHTATHLLHQALHDVLGSHVEQKGSNITSERLRFDFTHSQKMTEEEKHQVENIVNEKIAEKLPVQQIILPKSEAEKTGARHLFGEKYGDEVSIYFIGDTLENAYSKEFCGGPHVKNTEEIGKFKILKEEAVSAGVRRIKAVLEI